LNFGGACPPNPRLGGLPLPAQAGSVIRLVCPGGNEDKLVDRITETQLGMFCGEYGLENEKQDAQFEHFAAFSTIRRHYDRTFTPSGVIVGSGGDTGIDAIAIIVNNVLVTDPDTVEELAAQNGYVDATFIFVQAETSNHFDGKKISNIGVGVIDFFSDSPKLVRNEFVTASAAIAKAIYKKIGMFRTRPTCICYYVTTGKWVDDTNLVAYRTVVLENLNREKIFSRTEFHCFGADEIQRAYNQTRNPISRDFLFASRTDIPTTPGVGQAFLGFIPYSEFRRIVSDVSGNEILGSIFESNVRDWQDYSTVNKDIQRTLQSKAKSRFVLMNNGITIIARTIKQANHRFTIEDFQIVNGCQTSHVVFNEKELDDSVCIPLRLIETRDVIAHQG
jgi:hypothetical protein